MWTNPVLFRSRMAGKSWWTYAQVLEGLGQRLPSRAEFWGFARGLQRLKGRCRESVPHEEEDDEQEAREVEERGLIKELVSRDALQRVCLRNAPFRLARRGVVELRD